MPVAAPARNALDATPHGEEAPGCPPFDADLGLRVTPWGDVVMAEDGDDNRWPEEHVRLLTPSGEVKNLARNAMTKGEFAGVCLSPDGRALFVNLQGEGLSFVITGPFQQNTGTGP